ncbi:MAG: hypothetical protein JWO79_4742, partial [Actinomycetia bacterium]|nr:hypothetical protein [Actinomycetes bacterium]
SGCGLGRPHSDGEYREHSRRVAGAVLASGDSEER